MTKTALTLIIITTFILSIESSIPPETWQEHWINHNKLLTRQTYNPNLVVYSDAEIDTGNSLAWSLHTISEMWAYIKMNYGRFGTEPRLFLIIHSSGYKNGYSSTYFDPATDYRNIVDVNGDSLDDNNLDIVARQLANIVESGSKNVQGYPALPVWHDNKWIEIFTYDLYRILGLASDAERVKDVYLNNADDFPRSNTKWFSNWFYPIYNNYGKSNVLRRFFSLLASRFPKTSLGDSGYSYSRDLNFGEFVHFWSGAARTDLRSLAESAFGTNDEGGEDWGVQLAIAKSEFPDIGY